MNDSPQADHPSDLGLGHQFVQLSSALTTSKDALDPDRVVSLTVRAVPGAEHGALVLLRSQRAPDSVASTHAMALEMDRQPPIGDPLVLEPLERAAEVERRERPIALARRQDQPSRDLQHALGDALGRRAIDVAEPPAVLGEDDERRLARAQRGLEAERGASFAEAADPIAGDRPISADRREP